MTSYVLTIGGQEYTQVLGVYSSWETVRAEVARFLSPEYLVQAEGRRPHYELPDFDWYDHVSVYETKIDREGRPDQPVVFWSWEPKDWANATNNPDDWDWVEGKVGV